jgi:hypothetical protein
MFERSGHSYKRPARVEGSLGAFEDQAQMIAAINDAPRASVFMCDE